MSWLRLDDGFSHHPKVLKLTRLQRWTWVEILLYCARFKTAGVIPKEIQEGVREATPSLLTKLEEIGLVDQENGVIHIHDWHAYNPQDPTAALRMERYRNRNQDRNTDRNGAVTEPSPRARASAGGPVPSPKEKETSSSSLTPTDPPPPDDDDLDELLRKAQEAIKKP